MVSLLEYAGGKTGDVYRPGRLLTGLLEKIDG
jgi:hypothetical protein